MILYAIHKLYQTHSSESYITAIYSPAHPNAAEPKNQKLRQHPGTCRNDDLECVWPSTCGDLLFSSDCSACSSVLMRASMSPLGLPVLLGELGLSGKGAFREKVCKNGAFWLYGSFPTGAGEVPMSNASNLCRRSLTSLTSLLT